MQKTLCIESTEGDQPPHFAIYFEDGVKRHKAYRTQSADVPKLTMKSEPVNAVKTNPKECFRCGESNLTKDHAKNCKAANCKRKHCKVVVQLESFCNGKLPHIKKEMMQRSRARDNQMRRVNYIDGEESVDETDDDEEQLVLHVDGEGHKPFYMEGLL